LGKDVFTFPGGTVEIFDGLQLTAVWADIDGAEAQAYIFHILADVRGLPLGQFNNQVPDSWSLHCEDVAGNSSFTGIRPMFGTHNSGISLTGTGNDTAVGPGTALSLDRIPPGKTVWKVLCQLAGVDSRQGIVQELADTDPNLAFSPGFPAAGAVLKRDGTVYDGFPRPGPGLTWGTGSYTLHSYDSTTGKWWVGSTDATGSAPVWFGDPAAGTGAAWSLSFGAFNPHAATFGSSGDIFQFIPPVASEIPTGFTAYTPDPSGITLPRWFQLAAGISDDLKGKLTIATSIDDVLDSFFFVDPMSTFNRDAQTMCEITGCFMREDNSSVHIGRGVNGTSYSVDLAVPTSRLLRTSGESALTLTRSSEQDLPAEVRVQAIASEKADKFTERPARWERGPKPTSVSTRSESYRVQAGMTVNQMQTYASRTLDRRTEARDKASYKLPWQDAIAVQPGDIQTVSEDTLLYTVMVTQAAREANRIVGIETIRLHVAQDYQGLADAGTGYANPVALPTVTGTITGSITPVGSLHGVFLGASDGVIVGSMSPVGSLNAIASPPGATGTITGLTSPTGSLGGASAAPWTPDALTSATLKGWWKADDAASITSSSGAVSQWNDKSGNGNNLVQSTGTAKPTTGTTTLNSKNTLSFDGGDTLNKTSGVSFPDNSTGLTVLAVVKYSSASAAGWILFPTNSAASDFSWSFGRSGTNNMSMRGYQGTSANQASFNDNTTSAQMLSGIATTTLRQIWQNGTSKATNTNTDTSKPAGRIYLGADNNPTTFITGEIAEVIVISGTTQATREKAEGYLAWEWGLEGSLDAGHPYKSARPTV
jgi:hypothetical protein